MKRRMGMAVAVALMVLGVPAVANAKPAPLVCGSDGTLEVTGTVKLTADLTCDLEPADSAVIVLGGHTLTGFITPADIGHTRPAITVKDGTVTGYVVNAHEARVVDVKVVHATVEGAITVGTGTLVIRDSHVGDVLVSDDSGDSTFTITHNTMGGFRGLAFFPQGISGKITHNVLSGTIVIQSTGPIPDQVIDLHNTCAGVPC